MQVLWFMLISDAGACMCFQVRLVQPDTIGRKRKMAGPDDTDSYRTKSPDDDQRPLFATPGNAPAAHAHAHGNVSATPGTHQAAGGPKNNLLMSAQLVSLHLAV